MMLDYPKCDHCKGTTKLVHTDVEHKWYTDCPTCQGYGDMRINVIPELTDEDILELNSRENFALSEVFGLT